MFIETAARPELDCARTTTARVGSEEGPADHLIKGLAHPCQELCEHIVHVHRNTGPLWRSTYERDACDIILV